MSDRTAVADVVQPNGVEPVERAGMVAPGAAKQGESIELAILDERAEKLAQGLSNMRNEQHAGRERDKELTEAIARTEGAIIVINQLRQEARGQVQGGVS